MTRNSKHPTFKRDWTIPYSQCLANTINNYWGSAVSAPEGENNVRSKMKYGVPTHLANDNTYTHPDVIRVRWVKDALYITRRV